MTTAILELGPDIGLEAVAVILAEVSSDKRVTVGQLQERLAAAGLAGLLWQSVNGLDLDTQIVDVVAHI